MSWIDEVWSEIDSTLNKNKMDPENHLQNAGLYFQVSFQNECRGNPFTVCAVIEKTSGSMGLGASKRCKYGWEDGRTMSKKTLKALKNRKKPFLYDKPDPVIGQKYALKRAVKLMLEEMLVDDVNDYITYLKPEEGE
jgi:hypothetical protein